MFSVYGMVTILVAGYTEISRTESQSREGDKFVYNHIIKAGNKRDVVRAVK